MARPIKHPGDYLLTTDENYSFIGREKEKKKLTKLLCTKDTKILLLKGHPSAGKTRTAKEVVRAALRECATEYIPAQAYFISAQESKNMTKIKLELANQCGCMTTVAECPNMQNVYSAARLMADEYKIYILLDNVEDLLPDHQTELMKMCSDLVEINSTHQIVVVLTSRVELQFPRLTKEQFFMAELEPLSVADALTLLRLVCEDTEGGLEDEDTTDCVCLDEGLAVRLVKLLGRLPLAILTVGSMLRARDYTLEEALVLALDSDHNAGILTLSDEKFAQSDRLEIILETYLCKIQESVLTNLALINYIPGGFNPKAVATLVDTSVVLAKKTVIIPLRSRSVLSFDSKSQRFYISPPIKQYVEKHLSYRRDEPTVRGRFCRYYCKDLTELLTGFHKNPKISFQRLTEEYLNYEKSLKVADCKTEIPFADCLAVQRAAPSILSQYFHQGVIDFYRRLCDASIEEGTASEQAEVNMELASALDDICLDHKASSVLLEEAEKIMKSCGEDIPRSLLGKLYFYMGYNMYLANQWQRAVEVANKSQALLEKGNLSHCKAGNECVLGLSHMKLGNYAQAESHQLKAIEMRLELYGEHPIVGQAYNNLGLVYSRQDDWDRAFPTLLKGLELKEKYSGGILTLEVCASLYNVAESYYYRGDVQKAMETAEKALKMRKDLGWSHPLTSALLKNMGKYHLQLGNTEKAKEYSKEALEMRKLKECESVLSSIIKANG